MRANSDARRSLRKAVRRALKRYTRKRIFIDYRKAFLKQFFWMLAVVLLVAIGAFVAHELTIAKVPNVFIYVHQKWIVGVLVLILGGVLVWPFAKYRALASERVLVEAFEEFIQTSSEVATDPVRLGQSKVDLGSDIEKTFGRLRYSRGPYGVAIIDGLFNKFPISNDHISLFRRIKILWHRSHVGYSRSKHRVPDGTQKDYFALLDAYRGAIVGLKLGGDLRDKYPSDPRWARDYKSNPQYVKDRVTDGGNLSMRFRTASPHLQFPGEGMENNQAPRFLLVNCIRNRPKQMLEVLNIDDIIGCFEESLEILGLVQDYTVDDILKTLCTEHVKHFSKWDKRTFTERGGANDPIPGPVLRERPAAIGKKGYWIAWDLNRLDFSYESIKGMAKMRAALAVLERSIYIACQSKAKQVKLRPGETLILDNQRCLLRRREFEGRKSRPLLFRSPGSWYRVYYIFDRSDYSEF